MKLWNKRNNSIYSNKLEHCYNEKSNPNNLLLNYINNIIFTIGIILCIIILVTSGNIIINAISSNRIPEMLTSNEVKKDILKLEKYDVLDNLQVQSIEHIKGTRSLVAYLTNTQEKSTCIVDKTIKVIYKIKDNQWAIVEMTEEKKVDWILNNSNWYYYDKYIDLDISFYTKKKQLYANYSIAIDKKDIEEYTGEIRLIENDACYNFSVLRNNGKKIDGFISEEGVSFILDNQNIILNKNNNNEEVYN